MDKFNITQKELVEACEKVHYEGLRHKGLSGTICENLLIRALRKEFPDLHFDRGVIKFSDTNVKGEELNSNDLSAQLDIIIHRSIPVFEIEDSVVVHASQVLGIIEVKKWTYPKMLSPNSDLIKNIKAIQDRLVKYSKKATSVFFVTFRFHDRVNKSVNWFTNKDNLPSKYTYCFFGAFSHRDRKNLYPWEEPRWKDFENDPYAGQFKQLVHDINELTLP